MKPGYKIEYASSSKRCNFISVHNFSANNKVMFFCWHDIDYVVKDKHLIGVFKMKHK